MYLKHTYGIARWYDSIQWSIIVSQPCHPLHRRQTAALATPSPLINLQKAHTACPIFNTPLDSLSRFRLNTPSPPQGTRSHDHDQNTHTFPGVRNSGHSRIVYICCSSQDHLSWHSYSFFMTIKNHLVGNLEPYLIWLNLMMLPGSHTRPIHD